MDPCKPKYLDKESFMCCFVTYFDIGWWFQIFFIFTPKIGEDSHFD